MYHNAVPMKVWFSLVPRPSVRKEEGLVTLHGYHCKYWKRELYRAGQPIRSNSMLVKSYSSNHLP